MNKPLYDSDIVLWSRAQSEALRAAAAARLNTPVPVDWENVAEEIESLGRSQRTALRSRLRLVLEHLMKLAASPAKAPRRGWMLTINAQRAEIEDLLVDSPSLRQEAPELIAELLPRARRQVMKDLALMKECPQAELDRLAYTEAQVLDDWFPTGSPPPPPGAA